MILRGLPASPNILGGPGSPACPLFCPGPTEGLDEYLLEKQSGGGGLGRRVPSLPGHSQLHPGTGTITSEGWTRPHPWTLTVGDENETGGGSHGVSWKKGVTPGSVVWRGHSLVAFLGLPREHHYLY